MSKSRSRSRSRSRTKNSAPAPAKKGGSCSGNPVFYPTFFCIFLYLFEFDCTSTLAPSYFSPYWYLSLKKKIPALSPTYLAFSLLVTFPWSKKSHFLEHISKFPNFSYAFCNVLFHVRDSNTVIIYLTFCFLAGRLPGWCGHVRGAHRHLCQDPARHQLCWAGRGHRAGKEEKFCVVEIVRPGSR